MISRLVLALLIAAPAANAQFAPTAEERLRALTAPPPKDIYAIEKNADRQRIDADADALFGPERKAAIALFVSDDCTACDVAQRELRALMDTLGLEMQVLNIDTSEDARALHDRMTFDTVPSYVMHDRLIRGHMPDFVLKGYLTD